MNQQNTLKVRTYIGNYYILEVEYISDKQIAYRAEDMRYNREVLLHEYFPESMVKRNEESAVYIFSENSELFDLGKIEFHNLYNNLKMVNHVSIPSVYELFESSGTVFVTTKCNNNTINLYKYFTNSKNIFSEQEINKFAREIVRAFVLLKQHQLQIDSLNPQMLLMDTLNKLPIMAYTSYSPFDEDKSIEHLSYELGSLLYWIIDTKNFENNKPLSPLQSNGKYSSALCELVNRMISDDISKKIKTFQELQILLQACEPTSTVTQTKEKKAPPYLSLASIIFVSIFIYSIFTQEPIQTKDVTWFDSLRYHLNAYSGNIKGEKALGQMYEKGYYVDIDMKEAVLWYTKASQQGDFDALLSLANLYRNEEVVKDDLMAIKVYTQLANKGNLFAQTTLGISYLKGEGAPQNYHNAMYWFQKAQKQGDTYSYGAIAWMYEFGHGVTKDLNQARYWFKKGKDKQDKFSEDGYARIEQKSKELAEIALQEQNQNEYKMGYAYELGKGKVQNHQLAIRHYLRSAKFGNVKAQFRLAQLYARSNQIPRDYALALHWYKKAAEQGNALAYYRVSKLYREGKGVIKNEEIALKWCKKAAELGLGVAQGMMGSSYEFGWGTPINYTKARHWYKLAIQSGYENAVGRLQKLNKNQQNINNLAHNNKQKSKYKTQTTVRKNSLNTSPVNARACLGCHGKNFEKRALGKSAIVSTMRSGQIARALKGYKYGTYGGQMRNLMKGQVVRYSDSALEAFSKTIGR